MKSVINFLTEDAYGYQAIVYHRTIQPDTSEADILLRYFKDWGFESITGDIGRFKTLDDILSNGFHTKFWAAGKLYGNGVYCNYDLYSTLGKLGNNSTATMRKYGVVIIKSKLNLINSLVLDMKIAKKVFGKDYSFRSQCVRAGLKDIVDDLDSGKLVDQTNDASYFDTMINLDQLTSKFALHLIEHYQIDRRIGSILFTGSRDGHVAVVYNPKLLVPYSFAIDAKDVFGYGHKFTTDFTPLRITKDRINPTIKRHTDDLVDKEFDNVRVGQNNMNLITWGNGFTAYEDVDTEKYGIVDDDLNVIVPAKYDLVKWSNYTNNNKKDYLQVMYRLTSPVKDEDGYLLYYKTGVVDKTGKEIIEPGLYYDYQLYDMLDRMDSREHAKNYKSILSKD